ncbi:caspase family protein [Albidovulum sp.]|uniref:caspase family protein n=1 Tax=Albidovulum sp. TaxID=1872424 RepID=UPI0025C1E37E|nr:caspase family protein [Defluviimonas sp.]
MPDPKGIEEIPSGARKRTDMEMERRRAALGKSRRGRRVISRLKMCRLGMAVLLTTLTQAGALADAARAETRALLVGVSDYEAENVGLTDLRGPENDVRLLREVLLRLGVNQVETIADGVEDATRPSRAAIMDALARLAATSAPGDLIYVHFSGHGTQQADRDRDETDGLDEVFLAIDAAPGPAGSGVIVNSLVDDEIGRAVGAIRASGADVFVVFDSCHCGTALRGGAAGIVARYVEPSVFGIDVPHFAMPEPQADLTLKGDLSGRYLAFYAARSAEAAHEINLAEAEGGEAWFGLFSARLAARLETGTDMSYRQLFEAVLADLNDDALSGLARAQTPSWEGNLIDAPVLGRGRIGQPPARRFRVEGDEVMAGTVHGLGRGTLLAVLTAPQERIAGYAQITQAQTTRSVLQPVDVACYPRQDALCPAQGAIPAGAAYAQVVGRPLDLSVGIAPPIDTLAGRPLGATMPAAVALQSAIRDAVAAGQALRLDPARYTVESLWADGRLWFGPRVTSGGRPVGLAWEPVGSVPLAPLLQRVFEAETLARMLGAVAGETSPLNPSPVQVSVDLVPVAVEDLTPPGIPLVPVEECRHAQARAKGPSTALPAAAEVKQCDRLRFSGQGRVPGAWDVNRVYIDSRFCIRVDHTLIEGVAQAAPLGPDMIVCSDCPDGYAAGLERAFVIVTNAREHAEPLNLEGMLENCQTTGPVRGAMAGALRDFLATRARRPDTRGGFGTYEIHDVWVEQSSWLVLPREETFRRFEARRLTSGDAR